MCINSFRTFLFSETLTPLLISPAVITSTVARYQTGAPVYVGRLCVGVCECAHICVSMAVCAFFSRQTPVANKDGLISLLLDATVIQQSPSCTAFTLPSYSGSPPHESRSMVVMTTQSRSSGVTRHVPHVGYDTAEHHCPILVKAVQIIPVTS